MPARPPAQTDQPRGSKAASLKAEQAELSDRKHGLESRLKGHREHAAALQVKINEKSPFARNADEVKSLRAELDRLQAEKIEPTETALRKVATLQAANRRRRLGLPEE